MLKDGGGELPVGWRDAVEGTCKGHGRVLLPKSFVRLANKTLEGMIGAQMREKGKTGAYRLDVGIDSLLHAFLKDCCMTGQNHYVFGASRQMNIIGMLEGEESYKPVELGARYRGDRFDMLCRVAFGGFIDQKFYVDRLHRIIKSMGTEKNKLHDSLFIRLTCEEYRACLHVMALWWCVNSLKPLCFYSPPLSFSGTGWALSIVRQLSAIDMTGQQSPTYGITSFGS